MTYTMTDNRKVPVAYEEVTLTWEAVKILEKERKAALERPARKVRRVAIAPCRQEFVPRVRCRL